jgi:hypothetical protein
MTRSVHSGCRIANARRTAPTVLRLIGWVFFDVLFLVGNVVLRNRIR